MGCGEGVGKGDMGVKWAQGHNLYGEKVKEKACLRVYLQIESVLGSTFQIFSVRFSWNCLVTSGSINHPQQGC